VQSGCMLKIHSVLRPENAAVTMRRKISRNAIKGRFVTTELTKMSVDSNGSNRSRLPCSQSETDQLLSNTILERLMYGPLKA
jgi:hypothetical protein